MGQVVNLPECSGDNLLLAGQVNNLPHVLGMEEHGLFHRRRLPHWDLPGATYFITTCLAGSIPAEGLVDLDGCRAGLTGGLTEAAPAGVAADLRRWKKTFARCDWWLDEYPAVRHFADPTFAAIVADACCFWAGRRYDLLAYVVMPSHLHWVFRPIVGPVGAVVGQVGNPPHARSPRQQIMHTLKRYTARECNRRLGRRGVFWQDESYDHCVRDDDELERIIQYVEFNPVKAGLASRPEEWPYSSARCRADCSLRLGQPLVRQAAEQGSVVGQVVNLPPASRLPQPVGYNSEQGKAGCQPAPQRAANLPHKHMAHTIAIFGASGDLTSRKLIPALYELFRKKRLPGTNAHRRLLAHEVQPRRLARKLAGTTAHFVGKNFDTALWQQFAPSIFYHPGDIGNAEDCLAIGKFLAELEGDEAVTRVYYLSTAPQLYAAAVAQLGAAGLAKEDRPPRRVVIEKPFGTDLATARDLNRKVHEVFDEHQIYRIDHYLGKETVQNVMVLRFANSIFEPIWNRNYIDHVQITAAEDLTVGHRAAYYDSVGILRDMFQNHLLQLMTLTAMEVPAHFEANAVRDEKVKVLRAVRIMKPEEVFSHTLRGQYRKYRDEPGVPPESDAATFGVVKLHIDNWRWQDVPFLLRSGKAMSCRTTQIVIQFRAAPHMMFEGGPRAAFESNRLVIQVQPAEGIQLHFQTKVPDAGMKLRLTDLSFNFQDKFTGGMPEAYQRLLLDILHGDASLFSRADEVELAWSIVDPIQRGWEHSGLPPLALYEAGGWGPPNSVEWMCRQNREWFDSCPVLK